MLFGVGALLAEISVRLVGITSLGFKILEILVVVSVGTPVVVVVGALLLLLLLAPMLEVVALRVPPTVLVVAAFFLLKIASAITSVIPALVSAVEVTFVVATFPVATLVVGVATM